MAISPLYNRHYSIFEEPKLLVTISYKKINICKEFVEKMMNFEAFLLSFRQISYLICRRYSHCYWDTSGYAGYIFVQLPKGGGMNLFW